MRFRLFGTRTEAHIRRSLEYLEEANLAWVEHQAAAEHHAALAKMYSERIGRIEEEIKNSHQLRPTVLHQPPEDSRDEIEHPKAESIVVYPTRATR
ncbi:hypothetical protein [Polaromonas sp. CG9_12]|uniref:hypothetical protein n=1 Tax=Polaromonas sp. CG_9.11 TaxID=2787730 RepID=UPI0004DDD179|nr:hypothetical protein [Polaromonas sp. CG_9.11]MBG6076573.1 hypothetical protein [Polaromonas sp. CG_9.11]CDS49902.1 hypothetical protein [Polaromonas sp. CG9_12]